MNAQGVNCLGDVALGFSGSSATSYLGAYYTWHPAAGPSTGPPRLIEAGEDYYAAELPGQHERWGDYSATSLDPVDGISFWTVQQYAVLPDVFPAEWDTWIAELRVEQ